MLGERGGGGGGLHMLLDALFCTHLCTRNIQNSVVSEFAKNFSQDEWICGVFLQGWSGGNGSDSITMTTYVYSKEERGE
jgi:hypothetical protein